MKNPLVDALRQANKGDENVAVKASHVDVTEALPVTDETVPHDSMDLDLIDPSAEVESAENVAEPAKSIGGSADPLIEETADSDREPVAPAEVADRSPLAATSMLAARGATLENRTPMLPKIGRLAPILCLIGMSTAAGGYLLIDRLSSGSLNEDLDDMSERIGLGAIPEGGAGEQTMLPVTDISVVKRTAARNAASNALEHADAGMQNLRATNNNASSSTTGSGYTRVSPTIPIGVSRHTAPVIDDKAYQLVVAAFDAYQQQDYVVAENNYLQALAIEPNHLDALAGLGAVYQQTDRINLATENYQRLLGIDPGNTLAASALISLRSAEVDWDTESELKHLLQRFPLAHHLHFALASYFVEQGRWADARYEFRAAQELAPDNADYNFNLAVSLERLGNFEEARHYYEAAIATAGESANVDKQVVAQHLTKMMAQEREQL